MEIPGEAISHREIKFTDFAMVFRNSPCGILADITLINHNSAKILPYPLNKISRWIKISPEKMSSLAVKYRPRTFEEHVGQEPIVKALRNALRLKRISSAYLFAGPRGVGKTTTARIFAKGLNCEASDDITDKPCGKCQACRDIELGRHPDVIEIDAASNRGIDEIRAIRESVKYLPSRGRKKVYIIDEAHMLTMEAFNALLKTLEEPPDHVVFILATTDPHRIPPTILSRLQKYEFRPISPFDIIRRLQHIAKQEGIEVEDKALQEIARRSEGSLRDAISMLEQVWVFSGDRVTYEDVLKFVGGIDPNILDRLVIHIRKGESSEALSILDELLTKGVSPQDFVRELGNHLNEMLRAVLEGRRSDITREHILMYMNNVLKMEEVIRWSQTPRLWVEYYITRMSLLPSTVDLTQIARKYNLTYTPTGAERQVPRQPAPPAEEKEERGKKEDDLAVLLASKIRKAPVAGTVKESRVFIEGKKLIIKTRSEALREFLEKEKEEIVSAYKDLALPVEEVVIDVQKTHPGLLRLIDELSLKELGRGGGDVD